MRTIRIKRPLTVLLFFIGSLHGSYSQSESQEDFKIKGKIEGKIFTDFNAGLNKGDNTKNFELKRAYFGCKLQFDPKFYAKIRLDVGGAEFITPEINSQYVYFRRP